MNLHGGDLTRLLFEDFATHVDHELQCVMYGRTLPDGTWEDVNVAIECVDCGLIVIDVDNPEMGDEYVV
jgi:hypothetical protein